MTRMSKRKDGSQNLEKHWSLSRVCAVRLVEVPKKKEGMTCQSRVILLLLLSKSYGTQCVVTRRDGFVK